MKCTRKMILPENYGDASLYRDYYRAQAGSGLPGFHGAPIMYGAGVGGIFRSLFRKAVPLLRRGFQLVKPHVKTAASNIARDVVGRVSGAVMKKFNKTDQEGSGLIYLKRGRKRKRGVSLSGPPTYLQSGRKRRRQAQKSSLKIRRRRGKKRVSKGNIF